MKLPADLKWEKKNEFLSQESLNRMMTFSFQMAKVRRRLNKKNMVDKPDRGLSRGYRSLTERSWCGREELALQARGHESDPWNSMKRPGFGAAYLSSKHWGGRDR